MMAFSLALSATKGGNGGFEGRKMRYCTIYYLLNRSETMCVLFPFADGLRYQPQK